MKKALYFAFAVLTISSSCKKKSDDPAPNSTNTETNKNPETGGPSASSKPKKLLRKDAGGNLIAGTVFTYDAAGKLIKEDELLASGEVDPNAYANYEYNADGTLKKRTVRNQGSSKVAIYNYEYINGLISKITYEKEVYEYTYAGQDLTLARRSSNGVAMDSVVFAGYNEGGRPSTVTEYHRTAGYPWTKALTKYMTYDASNNLIKEEWQGVGYTNKVVVGLKTMSTEKDLPSSVSDIYLTTEKNPNFNSKDKDTHIPSESKNYSACSNATMLLAFASVLSDIKRDSGGNLISAKVKNIDYNNNYSTCSAGAANEDVTTITVEY